MHIRGDGAVYITLQSAAYKVVTPADGVGEVGEVGEVGVGSVGGVGDGGAGDGGLRIQSPTKIKDSGTDTPREA